FGGTRHPEIGADRSEDATGFNVVFGERLVAGEDAGRLPAGPDPADGVVDCRKHLGMLRIADVAKGRGEIARADEYPVDPFDCSDRLEVLKTAPRLDLNENAKLVFANRRVVLDAAEPARARRRRVAADALGRVAGIGDGVSRLLFGLD